MKIILLGSLPKGDKARKNWKDWKVEYMTKISKALPNSNFLHGDLISDKEGPEIVVGHDLYLIKHSDIAIVHATEKIGAGTAQEILIAKQFKKPVIVIIPKDSPHRMSNVVFQGMLIKDFINPFLLISTDYVATDIDDAIGWINKYVKKPSAYKIKDFSVMTSKISVFSKKFPQMVKKYKSQGW